MVSRVSKNPVLLPKGVEALYADRLLKIKGKHGELAQVMHPEVMVVHEDGQLSFAPKDDTIESNALSGTMRALAQGMVLGVTQGFEKKLELRGVGYRVKITGKELELNVGFSHPVIMVLPEGVDAVAPSQTELTLKSANKQLVAQFAANIRQIRPPEPYKGKGIRYFNEHVILKEGKKK